MPYSREQILLIGDEDRQIEPVLSGVLPGARIVHSNTYFDALAELGSDRYGTILGAAAAIERRPEAAVRAVRNLAGSARLLLFGAPSYEPLTRKMIEFGVDDYLITPTSPAELQQLFGAPPLRLTSAAASVESAEPGSADGTGGEPAELLSGLPLAEILIDALTHHPQEARRAAVARINALISPSLELIFTSAAAAAPKPPQGRSVLSHPMHLAGAPNGALHLVAPEDEDETAVRHALAQLAQLLSRLTTLEQRHTRLQNLAISDDLTGLHNCRYFRVFLEKILKRALDRYFPVTLLLFDIDDFKRYNDQFGHAVGDEILKQTARLIRSCCREHDHVARIGGDEFAVVFWEKDGPRQPRDPKVAAPASRVPQTIVDILQRFQNTLASSDLQALGAQGQGLLNISGGLAVYPFDAHTPDGLYDAADRALMFGAKKSGKNSIYLVGTAENASS